MFPSTYFSIRIYYPEKNQIDWSQPSKVSNVLRRLIHSPFKGLHLIQIYPLKSLLNARTFSHNFIFTSFYISRFEVNLPQSSVTLPFHTSIGLLFVFFLLLKMNNSNTGVVLLVETGVCVYCVSQKNIGKKIGKLCPLGGDNLDLWNYVELIHLT